MILSERNRRLLAAFATLGYPIVAMAAVAVGAQRYGLEGDSLLAAIVAAVTLPAAAYVVWHQQPALIFTAAFMLSPISSNWQALGVPGALAPDRLLLIAAIGMVALRSPRIRDRPPLRLEAVHFALALSVAIAVASAIWFGSITDKGAMFRILESYGVLPFLTFAFAPLAFRTPEQRRILLYGLLALGLYLGLTAIFERINLDALIFPRYILDPSVGIHFDRSRGPFVEASTNGLGLYVGATAALIGFIRFKSSDAKLLCAGIALTCLLGTFLTLQREVWIAAMASSLVVFLALPRARRFLGASFGLGVVVIIIGLLASSSFSTQVDNRISSPNSDLSTYERLNMMQAAINMTEANPLFGQGWDSYDTEHYDYFQLSQGRPLAGGTVTLAHNVFLNNAAETGLVGASVWTLALIMMVWGAMRGPRSPDLEAWRATLLPVALFALVVMLFTPPKVFGTLVLCLWAGVVWSGRYESSGDPVDERDRPDGRFSRAGAPAPSAGAA